MQVKWTIYLHIHVESRRAYVGLTKKTVLRRWNQHVLKSRKPGRSHFWNAIQKYGPKAFSHYSLMVFDSVEEGNAWEKFWINFLDTKNPLYGFNLAPGGSHMPHPIKNPWDRPEYRANHAVSLAASLRDPQVLANRAAASRANWEEGEFREKVSASIREAWDDPDYRARMTASSKEVNSRPEVRAAISAAASGRTHTPETRARISAARTGKITSPAVRAKISASGVEAFSDPDRRAEISRRSKALWADPAYREKMAAARLRLRGSV